MQPIRKNSRKYRKPKIKKKIPYTVTSNIATSDILSKTVDHTISIRSKIEPIPTSPFFYTIKERSNNYVPHNVKASIEARKIWFELMNSDDESIKSLTRDEKIELINRRCSNLIRDIWEKNGKKFDLQSVLDSVSLLSTKVTMDMETLSDFGIDENTFKVHHFTEVGDNVISEMKSYEMDRSYIKNPGTFDVITTEFGPTKEMSRCWDPGKTLLDQYNELSAGHKYIVDLCCTDIRSNIARIIIPLLADPESAIHETNSLFAIGALTGLDIVDELLYNIFVLCHNDFGLMRQVVTDYFEDKFTKEDIINFANKDWLTQNPIYLKYMKRS